MEVKGRPHRHGDMVPAEGSPLAGSQFGQRHRTLWHCAVPSLTVWGQYQWPELRGGYKARQ